MKIIKNITNGIVLIIIGIMHTQLVISSGGFGNQFHHFYKSHFFKISEGMAELPAATGVTNFEYFAAFWFFYFGIMIIPLGILVHFIERKKGILPLAFTLSYLIVVFVGSYMIPNSGMTFFMLPHAVFMLVYSSMKNNKKQKMVKSTSTIVQNSIIGNGFGKIDFCDSYSIVTTKSESVDEITAIVFGGVKWLDNLFAPLYKIVKWLGLNAMKKEPNGEEPYFPIGSKAVMFTVINRNGNEIVMGESERILDFRTSVFKEISGDKTIVHLTTIVKYNNIWGRLYFLPVKPFHRFICKQILKNYIKVKN